MAVILSVEVDWTRTGHWVDETCRARRVVTWAGFERPGDPVAAIGRATVELDNTGGRYSPDNGASPLSGDVTPGRPLRVRASDGVQTWTVFYGYIERIAPNAGYLGAQRVRLEAFDGPGWLAAQPLSAVYADRLPVTEAIAIITSLAYAPPALAIGDNGDVLTHFGRAWLPEQTSCLDALRDVCQAVYGRFWQARDGTATYWTREQRQQGRGSFALTIDSTAPPSTLAVVEDVAGVINRVQVTVYPPDVVGTLTEIWRAHTALLLAPGATRTVSAPFRDTNGQRVGALDVADLEMGVDVQINTRRDASGKDWTGTGLVTASLTAEATRAVITLANASSHPLYVTLLRVRGRPIRTYDPIVIQRDSEGSQFEYGVRTLALDLVMQSDPGFAEGLAAYVIAQAGQPQLTAERLTLRDQKTIDGVSVFGIEVMDLVEVRDAQSTLVGRHRVRALSYRVEDSALSVELLLERADERPYWRLETVGAGELAHATIRGF
jgi:hypothetical protein